MLKRAYQLGIKMAFEEAGMTKEAFLGGAITKGLGSLAKILPAGGQKALTSGLKALNPAVEWGLRNPLAARTAVGAGAGGITGGLFGDEGGFMRGALMGAGMGAGSHAGRLAALGKGGRASESVLRNIVRGTPTKFFQGLRPDMQANIVSAAQKNLQALAPKALAGGAAGALGAGALGYGMAGGLVPGRDRQRPSWYMR